MRKRRTCRSPASAAFRRGAMPPEFMVLGAGSVQVCTAADALRLSHRDRSRRRPLELDGRKGLRQRSTISAAAPVPNVTDWKYLNLKYEHQGAHRPGQVHQVRPVPHRVRRHRAPGDHKRKRRRRGISKWWTPNASAAICACTCARSSNASRWSAWTPASTRTGPRIRTIRRA